MGKGNPVNPVGLIASVFRPSDDATTFLFLVPSNFFAVTSLRKAAEILTKVNGQAALAAECTELACLLYTSQQVYTDQVDYSFHGGLRFVEILCWLCKFMQFFS